MSTTNSVDEYLATLDEPKRATLTSLRDTIMAKVPEAEHWFREQDAARGGPQTPTRTHGLAQ
jgi:hypothetical protein